MLELRLPVDPNPPPIMPEPTPPKNLDNVRGIGMMIITSMLICILILAYSIYTLKKEKQTIEHKPSPSKLDNKDSSQCDEMSKLDDESLPVEKSESSMCDEMGSPVKEVVEPACAVSLALAKERKNMLDLCSTLHSLTRHPLSFNQETEPARHNLE